MYSLASPLYDFCLPSLNGTLQIHGKPLFSACFERPIAVRPCRKSKIRKLRASPRPLFPEFCVQFFCHKKTTEKRIVLATPPDRPELHIRWLPATDVVYLFYGSITFTLPSFFATPDRSHIPAGGLVELNRPSAGRLREVPQCRFDCYSRNYFRSWSTLCGCALA